MSFVKNIIFFPVVFIFFMSCNGSNFSEDDLLGTWQGKYNNRDIIITFNADDFKMEIQNKEKDSYDILDGTYLINFKKKPIPISFRNISNLNHPLHTIIFFKNYETIVMKDFTPSWKLRYISFDDSKNNLTLKRLTNKE